MNIYHEKQVKELCALHALNNLFQRTMFSKKDLDDICEHLAPSSWFNPHRSLLGLGNYDINVILYALQTKNYEGIWFDKRKDPMTINFESVEGFILNTPNNYAFGVLKLPFNRRHWFAICRVNTEYFNLDSKLPAPIAIGREESLIELLRTELKNNDRELFIVVKKEVEESGSWIKVNSEKMRT